MILICERFFVVSLCLPMIAIQMLFYLLRWNIVLPLLYWGAMGIVPALSRISSGAAHRQMARRSEQPCPKPMGLDQKHTEIFVLVLVEGSPQKGSQGVRGGPHP
jgi:hypothetical protein